MDSQREGHRKRLRQKFTRAGLEGLHDYEVVELLLTYAIPRRDVKPVAKALIKRFGGLKGVLEAGAGELAAVRGLGPDSARLLTLPRGSARAYLSERRSAAGVVSGPGDAVRHAGASGAEDGGESFSALYLNSKNELLGVELLCEGTPDTTVVSPRRAIEKAFEHNARSVIFVHRKPWFAAAEHGTGEELTELELVRALEQAASAIDILVHDYIVVGGDAHFSAREAGLLKGG